MLFQKIIPSEPLQPITSEIAKECYGYLKQYGTISEAFSKSCKYPFHYFEETMNEVERLENLCTSLMNEKEKPSSKKDLRSKISSELIDCDIFLDDYIDYVMTYEENTTWEDFISQFPKNEGFFI